MVLSALISVKANDRFKIPNPEVMTDRARWLIGDVEIQDDILKTCVEGPVSDFAAKWPNFMQQPLDPKLVSKMRGAISHKTPERIYHVLFWGLMQSRRVKGWDVFIERRAGGYVDSRLHHNKALKQIEDRNYRNSEVLPSIRILREYGIAGCHLSSYVKGRYLELNGQNQWAEKDDPMMGL